MSEGGPVVVEDGGGGGSAVEPGPYVMNEGWATEAQLTKMVAATAADYTSYVNVASNESLKEDMDVLGEDVNTLLARMDEFHGLVNTIKADTATVATEVAPQLTEHCNVLNELFEKISNLEHFVSIVKKNVGEMDDEISACERKNTMQPLRAARNVLATRFSALMGGGGTSSGSGTGTAKAGAVDVEAGEGGGPSGGGQPQQLQWTAPTPFKTSEFFLKGGGAAAAAAAAASPSGKAGGAAKGGAAAAAAEAAAGAGAAGAGAVAEGAADGGGDGSGGGGSGEDENGPLDL